MKLLTRQWKKNRKRYMSFKNQTHWSSVFTDLMKINAFHYITSLGLISLQTLTFHATDSSELRRAWVFKYAATVSIPTLYAGKDLSPCIINLYVMIMFARKPIISHLLIVWHIHLNWITQNLFVFLMFYENIACQDLSNWPLWKIPIKTDHPIVYIVIPMHLKAWTCFW